MTTSRVERCNESAPDGMICCGRAKGHRGRHEMGILDSNVTVQWGDNEQPLKNPKHAVIDASTRVGQAAICAALRALDPPEPGFKPTTEQRALAKSLFAAIDGIDVDRCVVASDGKRVHVMLVQGTPHLHFEYDECTLNDLLRDTGMPPGIWLYEGRLSVTEHRGEYDTNYEGRWRAITDEDRITMWFTDEQMRDEAISEEFDL